MTEEERMHENGRRWLMVASSCLNVLALLGMIVTAVFVVQQRDYTACQRAYNDSVQLVLRERGEAGDLDRRAIRLIAESGAQMVTVILPPAPGQPVPSQQDRVDAVQKWRDDQRIASGQLKEADEKRAANPIPPPTQC